MVTLNDGDETEGDLVPGTHARGLGGLGAMALGPAKDTQPHQRFTGRPNPR